MKTVDVAIIGAGSAGLSALKEVQKKTQNYLLIQDGPLGTTCARVGCMPSKTLIQVANEYHQRLSLSRCGIHGGKKLTINTKEALTYVRKLRDHFVEGVLRTTDLLGNRLQRGRAAITKDGIIKIGKITVHAKRIIIATGSTPIVPEDFRALGEKLITTDSLFELEDLPKRVAVVGMGAIGLEMGQALSRLGVKVVAFNRSQRVGGLSDPEINGYAQKYFGGQFPLHLKTEVQVKKTRTGVEVRSGKNRFMVDAVVASLGRQPQLKGLGLEELGILFDKKGVPIFDPATMQIQGHPIFLIGDVSAHRTVLHEASDEGRIAGYNSVRKKIQKFRRRAPLAITFCEPNIAVVGKKFETLEKGKFVTGKVSFEKQGRARILGANIGILHLYASQKNGKFLGAEIFAPRAEHLAHLLAWALGQELTIFEMLQMPFYHPVLEEGLRTALRDAASQVQKRQSSFELVFCGPSA